MTIWGSCITKDAFIFNYYNDTLEIQKPVSSTSWYVKWELKHFTIKTIISIFPDSQKEATAMSYLFYLMATIFHIDTISSVKFIHNHCYDWSSML